eukprot:772019-Pleurochrysis_carterae.AAC.6
MQSKIERSEALVRPASLETPEFIDATMTSSMQGCTMYDEASARHIRLWELSAHEHLKEA